jgi:TolB-like protein
VGATPLLASEHALGELSRSVAAVLEESGKRRVAVVDFTDLDGEPDPVGSYLAEELSVALVGVAKDFAVVDRLHLRTILSEHELVRAGVFARETTQKLLEVTGVDAIVTGRVTAASAGVRVSVKILDTATTNLLGASSASLERDPFMDELLADSRGAVAPDAASPARSRPTPPTVAVAAPAAESPEPAAESSAGSPSSAETEPAHTERTTPVEAATSGDRPAPEASDRPLPAPADTDAAAEINADGSQTGAADATPPAAPPDQPRTPDSGAPTEQAALDAVPPSHPMAAEDPETTRVAAEPPGPDVPSAAVPPAPSAPPGKVVSTPPKSPETTPIPEPITVSVLSLEPHESSVRLSLEVHNNTPSVLAWGVGGTSELVDSSGTSLVCSECPAGVSDGALLIPADESTKVDLTFAPDPRTSALRRRDAFAFFFAASTAPTATAGGPFTLSLDYEYRASGRTEIREASIVFADLEARAAD